MKANISQPLTATPQEATTPNEERILRFLCHDRTDSALRQELLSRLRYYSFREMHHQVLFDCLCNIPWHRPDMVRVLLPTWLVHAGFPDFDLQPFLESPDLTSAEARRLSLELVREQQPRESKRR